MRCSRAHFNGCSRDCCFRGEDSEARFTGGGDVNTVAVRRVLGIEPFMIPEGRRQLLVPLGRWIVPARSLTDSPAIFRAILLLVMKL